MQSDETEYVTWVQAQTNKVKESIDIIIEKLKEPDQETEKWRKRISHNNFYKTLYGIPRFSSELLSKVLPKQVLRLLDISKLKRKPETVHNFAGRERLCDMVFTAPYKSNAKKFAIIEIEFQSTSDRNFPWRMIEYKCALLDGLQERHPDEFKDKKLPHVFMLAYYNGDSNWNAPLNTLDLFEDPEDGERDEDALSSGYYLFDVKHRDHKELDGINDLTSLIFRVERALHLEDQKQTLTLILDIMNLARKIFYEEQAKKKAAKNVPDDAKKNKKAEEEDLFNGAAYRALLRWCESVTITFGLRAFVVRREPEDAMNIAKAFYDKAKEDGVIIGKAEGLAEDKGKAILKYFPSIFNNGVPTKLRQLITKLQNKGDLNSLEKLLDFIVLRKGSKDEFMKFAESLEA